MRIVWISSLVFIFNFFGLGSHFESLPNGEAIPNVPRSGSSANLSDKYFPERLFPPARLDSPGHLPIPVDAPLRVRTRSPGFRIRPPLALGFTLEELEFVQLILKKNPARIYKLRKYTFPSDESFLFKTQNNVVVPMLPEEHIVLSTPDGDVCAIFEKTSKHVFFRGIYKSYPIGPRRAKINIHSGAVNKLTAQEIAECPVNKNIPIKKTFQVVYEGQSAAPYIPIAESDSDAYHPST